MIETFVSHPEVGVVNKSTHHTLIAAELWVRRTLLEKLTSRAVGDRVVQDERSSSIWYATYFVETRDGKRRPWLGVIRNGIDRAGDRHAA